jgi:serpin B
VPKGRRCSTKGWVIVTPHRSPGRFRSIVVVAAVVTTLALVTSGCSTEFSGTEVRGNAPYGPPPASAVGNVVAPATTLGAAVLAELAATTDGNVAFSPSLLATQLAMVRLGAATASAAEIDALLELDTSADVDQFVASVAATESLLVRREGLQRSSDRRGRIVVGDAVALWIQRGTELGDDYLTALSSAMDSGVRQVDFASGADTARQAVNRWASEATGGRVEQLVTRGRITTSTQLLSTGALWLSAPWLHPFDAAATTDAPFTTDTGRQVQVAMMELPPATGTSWARGPQWQAVELPFLGRQLSMVAIVADPGADDVLDQAFDADFITEVTSALSRTPVVVRMPRFAFTTQAAMSPSLTALGAVTLFNRDQADLTGLAPAERMALSEIIQEVFVSVDEEGSAARVAATTGSSRPSRAADVEVTFDRPFVVLVVDRSSRLPLIAARVGDPTQ